MTFTDALPETGPSSWEFSPGDGQAGQGRGAGLLALALDSGDGTGGVPAVAGAPVVAGFEIISRLGAGSSGEVWLADEVETGRIVALKVLHRHGMGGAPEEVLQREFRILAKLVHPHLVLLYHGIVTADGRQGLAMEWIDGWPLDEWLEQHPDLPLGERLELFRGVVRGVAFLHEHGVIHRDLKPANVIVDTRGVPKIVDFGLARLHQEGAASGNDGGSIGVSGTLHFMAPEQAADAAGARSMPVDVYALGLILHRLLTGRWLYPAEGTPAETLALVLKPPPLVPRGPGRPLPRDLQGILRQALAPDPARRYHHARDLEADLERFSARLPVAARRHTLLYLATTFLRRQARRSAWAGAVVLAGLVAGGMLYHRQRVVAARNEANLKYAYTLASFTIRQLRDELRDATPVDVGAALATTDLPAASTGVATSLPLDAGGELDLRYFQAMLADLRSATSEGHAKYGPALKSIQQALDLYARLAKEAPEDPARLLDAAQARLSFARLLDRAGRADLAGGEAGKALRQLDRLAAWRGYDPAPLLPLRCAALRLQARQAHHRGDAAGAVRICAELLALTGGLPAAALARPENEALPRQALAASDLATYAIAAGPSHLAEARREIRRITEVYRAAREREPGATPLACGLALCLDATARLSLHQEPGEDLLPIFQEINGLLTDRRLRAAPLPLSLVWDLSRTAVHWGGVMHDHPDLATATTAFSFGRDFNAHLRRNGWGKEDVMLQRARICLYQSRLACRAGNRQAGVRPISSAVKVLRPRQAAEPDRLPLSLLTAGVLHQAETLADFPETGWNQECAGHLAGLLTRLSGQVDQMTAEQRRELDAIRR